MNILKGLELPGKPVWKEIIIRLLISSVIIFFTVYVVTGRVLTAFEVVGAVFLLTNLVYFFIGFFNKDQKVSSSDSLAVINNQAPYLFQQSGKIKRADRERLNGGKAFTLWFTGLSGAGKSTLAAEIEAWLHNQGVRVYVLDGDNTRLGINKDLSFSDQDRSENIRRVIELCRLFNDAGIIIISSFISPFAKDRQLARTLIGEDSFIEVFIDASISECKKRDPKGLYKLAMIGKIKNFTGIDSIYEEPQQPEIYLKTDLKSKNECVKHLQEYLISRRAFFDYQELPIMQSSETKI